MAKAKRDLSTAELKRSPQGDAVWEADLRALPKPVGQTDTHSVGFVVAPDGHLLAERSVLHTTSADDLAILLIDTLAAARAALERGLNAYSDEQGS